MEKKLIFFNIHITHIHQIQISQTLLPYSTFFKLPHLPMHLRRSLWPNPPQNWECHLAKSGPGPRPHPSKSNPMGFIEHSWQILLMEEILHQLIGSLSHYLQGFIHPRWCRISSINSIAVLRLHFLKVPLQTNLDVSLETVTTRILQRTVSLNATVPLNGQYPLHNPC